MFDSKPLAVVVLTAVALSGGVGAEKSDGNATRPGAFFVDDPTIHNLAFRWVIQGDANGNAAAAVTYRKAGTDAWRPALPMMRVDNQPVEDLGGPEAGAWFAGIVVPRGGPLNLFAGSVLNLQEATSYEVRFELTDPDGLAGPGASGNKLVKAVTVSTRAAPPENYQGKRQVHVYPPDYKGQKKAPAFADLAAAFKDARAGDVVLLHAGRHPGRFRPSVTGTAEAPLVFRGAGDGPAVIDGEGYYRESVVQLAPGCHHVWFEDLTVKSGWAGIRAIDSDWLVIRRCKVLDCNYGITIATKDEKEKGFHRSNNWYVADNWVQGRYPGLRPREKWYYGCGVQVSGRGHVVCHNRVLNFWDCIGTGHVAPPLREQWLYEPDGPMQALDFYNNEVSGGCDDGMEIDYVMANVRILRNRITSSYQGISLQPAVAGPIYITHNVTPSFKLNYYVAGARLYHNLLVSTGLYTTIGRNLLARNNIFVNLGSLHHDDFDLDYNGYLGFRRARFSGDRSKTWTNVASLAELREKTGSGAHSLMLNRDKCFAKPWTKVRYHGFATPEQAAEAALLTEGCPAVDAGLVLPTVNDDFAGQAPDLGPYELGKDVPRYGPRVEGMVVTEAELALYVPAPKGPEGVEISPAGKLEKAAPSPLPRKVKALPAAEPAPPEAYQEALVVRGNQTGVVLLKAGEQLRGKLLQAKAGVKSPQPCEVIVSGPDGRELLRKKATPDAGDFQVKAEKAGLHRIDVKGARGTTRLLVENPHFAVVAPQPYLHLMFAQPEAYFYVPPGAKEAEVSIRTAGPLESCVLTLYNADAERVVSVDTAVQPTYRIKFKVPPAQAGKAWSVTFTPSPREGKIDDIMFTLGAGCGRFLATHPSRLIVGQE